MTFYAGIMQGNGQVEMIGAGGFHADDDTRQFAQFLDHPGMVGTGVGILLRIEWLAVLAHQQNQFFRSDINAGEEAGCRLRRCFLQWVVSHFIVNPVVGG